MRLLFFALSAAFAAAPALAASVVLDLKVDRGLPFVNCSFDGVPTRCLLDSGSFASVVHNLPPFNKYPVSKLIAGELELVRISSLFLGGDEFGPIHAIRSDHPFPTIGADVLSQRRIFLDAGPPTHVIFNRDDAGFSRDQSLEIDRDHRFILKVYVGDRQVRAMWDTGTAETRLVEGIVNQAPREDFIRGEPYDYRKDAGARNRARRIRIAGETFSDVPILASNMTLSGGVQMLLGWDLISQLDWDFDPGLKTWTAKRPP